MIKYPLYYKYWGKTDREDPNKYHLLPYHCLDVAAVGWYLLDPATDSCKNIAAYLNVSPEWLQKYFCFCLSLHDIGKFATAFQSIVPNKNDELVPYNPRMPYDERHDTLGFWLWRGFLSSRFNKLYPDEKVSTTIESWLEIVTGHHGIPPKKSGGRICSYFESVDEDAAYSYMKEMLSFFISSTDSQKFCDKDYKKRLKTISWQLAGISVLADWLGSNQEYFQYCSEYETISSYWAKYALPSAEKAIKSLPVKPETRRFQGLRELFPFITQPTPLQEYALKEPLSGKQHLFILEDVTGAGKTEAALILTLRLLSENKANGLYVALPTMATANAMYQRLGIVYRKFFKEENPPSLILAHGARELSNSFHESIALKEDIKKDMNYLRDDNEEEDELSATAYCNAWIADNRKKALLADVGVGTLDQALLGVLPARHQSLRLLGLAKKVLLIDEVHAYDSYMQRLLACLLEAHAKQGGSVILLSATLPKNMSEKLFEAFQRGVGKDFSTQDLCHNSYPLATHASIKGGNEKHIDTREDVKRTVYIEQIDSEKSVYKQIKQAVTDGKCVCWIRNTVKAAHSSYADLSEFDWMNKDNIHLFHSRFAMIDRQLIEIETLERFGKDSDQEKREGQVLIATQVVEQSLDIDFDVLITDLAPIDLIIQRAGRLCRHIRDKHGKRLRGTSRKDGRGAPVLYVFTPYPVEHPDAQWIATDQKGTQAVYPHIGQLWLTARLLLNDNENVGRGKITMPDDARRLIESVYSEEAEDNIPMVLIDASREAISSNFTKKSLADLNALKLEKGYSQSSGDWDEESRIPTRLTEQETITVALARLSNGELTPYAQGSHHAWAMSVVKIPEWEWKNAIQQIPDQIKKSIEKLKEEVKALRWFEVFPLMEETAQYYDPKNGWQTNMGENK